MDTLADIANSMNTALAGLGFPTHPVDSYRYFVGDGTVQLARRVLPKEHVNDKMISRCLAIMDDEYSRRWAENTKPYEQIPELLTALDNLGVKKAVLSNKPDEFARITIENLLPHWSFQIVRGVGPTVPPKPDPATAIQIANELNIPSQRFLYLGDTNTDMRTAISAGMFPVGAVWGFRAADELQQYGAKALAKTPLEVLDIMKDNKN